MSPPPLTGLDTLRDLTRRMTDALQTERMDIFMACAEKRIRTLKDLFSHPEQGRPPESVIQESIADNQTWINLIAQLMAAKKAEIERLQIKKKARRRVDGAYHKLSQRGPFCIQHV